MWLTELLKFSTKVIKRVSCIILYFPQISPDAEMHSVAYSPEGTSEPLNKALGKPHIWARTDSECLFVAAVLGL